MDQSCNTHRASHSAGNQSKTLSENKLDTTLIAPAVPYGPRWRENEPGARASFSDALPIC